MQGDANDKLIAVAAGKWSGNVGNAFFNLGAKYALEQSVPQGKVVFVSDQAAYWSYYPWRYRQEPRHSLKYNNYIRPDYLVLQGSLLTKQFPRIWGEAFEIYRKNNIKIVLLGVGQFDYDQDEVAAVRAFLKRYPPYVLVSRDSETFENFKDLAEFSYDGIDNAYFLTEVYQPVPHDLEPYLILNFDKSPEPMVYILEKPDPESLIPDKNIRFFNFQQQCWKLQFPKLRYKLSESLGKLSNFVLAPLRLAGTSQKKVGNWQIVRTDHASNPNMLSRMFRGPNSFCDDLPYTYLNLYALTELTLSDRIHAVLVTLAYGKPAMLISKSGRAKILERLGTLEVTRQPVMLDLDRLQREKAAEINFLRSLRF